jgi:hypothetical protein
MGELWSMVAILATKVVIFLTFLQIAKLGHFFALCLGRRQL